MAHPTEIPGFTLKELARAVENLRYAQAHVFIQELAYAFQNRADEDQDAGKSFLAFKLHSVSDALFSAARHCYAAGDICARHED